MTSVAAHGIPSRGPARASRRRYHLGVPFLVYTGLTVLVALAAMNGGSNLLTWVFGILISALLVSGAVSGTMMTRLRVRRLHPGHGVAGEPLVVQYEIVNRGHVLPAFDIHLEERPAGEPGGAGGWEALMPPAVAWVMHIGPRQTVHGEATFRPERRGVARFGELRVRTSFPFGVIGKSITRVIPQRVLIHPRVMPLRRGVLEAIVPPAALGTRVTAHAGAGDDYYGLREFRPGDSLRNIAWKRTANRDLLVSIERTLPSPPQLRVVLDLSVPTEAIERGAGDPPARTLEERAISIAASLVHAADAAGFEVGLTVIGDDRPPIAVRRGHWHRNRVMAALAEIDLDAPRAPRRPLAPGPADRAGLVVVHPDRADPSIVRAEAWHLTARQIDHLVEEEPTAPTAEPEGPA